MMTNSRENNEGQRKALFEEIASETKRDADEIVRVREDIAKVRLTIYEQRRNILGGSLPVVAPLPATVSSAPCKRVTQASGGAASTNVRSRTALASIAGRNDSEADVGRKLLTALVGNPAKQKSLKDVVQQLDLQRIDKNKQLDLLVYKRKQKEAKLKKLAMQYQELFLKKNAKVAEDEVKAKNDILAKEYRNRIHAVQVRIKEAEHVRIRYRDIRWKLLEDAAQFESKMADVEMEIKAQDVEIHKVKEVNKEALKLRSDARVALLREERQVLAANATREKQNLEGRRLVEARQCDLARLEKHFYQRKASRTREQLEIHRDEENNLLPEKEQRLTLEQQLKIDIDVLNEATASSCIEEVLAKVKGQTTTQIRLMTLRQIKEKIKQGKQRKFDERMQELEKLKFADDKSTQQNQEDLADIKRKIDKEQRDGGEIAEKTDYVNGIVTKIVDKLLNTYLCMHQEENENVDKMAAVDLIRKINVGIENLQIRKCLPDEDERGTSMEKLLEELQEREGKWLPEAYNTIIRGTPVTTSDAPTPIPTQNAPGGSEDEEDLPTRSYLKRQAQLVVDAKNKRKTMRFPIPKTK